MEIRGFIISSSGPRICERILAARKKWIARAGNAGDQRHTSTWWTDIDPEEHYTLVELRDIRESYEELLDVGQIKNYVSDVGPVDFAPAQQFAYGPVISRNLQSNVPDYSPKNVYISGPSGERQRIYRPTTTKCAWPSPVSLK